MFIYLTPVLVPFSDISTMNQHEPYNYDMNSRLLERSLLSTTLLSTGGGTAMVTGVQPSVRANKNILVGTL